MLLEAQAVILYKFRWPGDPELMVSTIGIDTNENAVEFGPADAEFVAGTFIEFLLPLMNDLITLDETEIIQQFAAGSTSSIFPSHEPGSVAANLVPQNTAYLVRKGSTGIGRGRSGRMYLPGVGEPLVLNDGELTSGHKDAWDEQLALFLAAAIADWPTLPVLNHGLRKDPADPPGSPPTLPPEFPWSEITSLFMDPIVATQRRRLRP